MISSEALGLISVAISALSYLIYIIFIFIGRTKPHVFSWFIWGVMAAIIFLAQVVDNGGPGAWATGFSACIFFVISALALFKGEKNIRKSDWICLITALMAIPLWYFTSTPLYSVILVSIIDTIGFIPTFRKSYSNPRKESRLSAALAGWQHVTSTLALKNFSFITAFYPLLSLCLNWGLVLMLLWRRSVVKKQK